MRAAMILSGGVAHDFPATSAALTGVLAEAGFGARTRTDINAALTELADPDAGVDLLVVNCMRWHRPTAQWQAQRAQWWLALDQRARAGMLDHLRAGRGVLAMHTASICFDDWPRWAGLLGGRWVRGRSTHPPIGPARVAVRTDAHPVVAGVTDFEVYDEIYSYLDVDPRVRALATCDHGGATHPLVWAREDGGARVVYDALGHGPESYTSPTHRRLIAQAARWAAGTPG